MLKHCEISYNTRQEEQLLMYLYKEGGNCNLTLAHPLLNTRRKTVPMDLGQVRPAGAAIEIIYRNTEEASLERVAASCVLVSMSARLVSVGS